MSSHHNLFQIYITFIYPGSYNMRLMSTEEYNEFFDLKQKEFLALDYSTIDPGMVPILKTLSNQNDIVPNFSCEGHLDRLGKRKRADSYISFVCKDANIVIGAAEKLLRPYMELGIAFNSRPMMDFSALTYTKDRTLGYPAYTFRKGLTNELEKEFWLKHLNECFVNQTLRVPVIS